MFEGDWNEAAQSKPLFDFSYFCPEITPEFLEAQSMCFGLPETGFDLQMVPQRRDEDVKDYSACFYPFQDWFPMPEQPLAPTSPSSGEVQDGVPEGQKPVQSSLLKVRIPYPHAKQVGTISLEERKVKIERFLEKRRRRNFHKKVVYVCRKRVADTRIRVKGRFVAKGLAAALKGLENDKNNVSVPGEKQE